MSRHRLINRVGGTLVLLGLIAGCSADAQPAAPPTTAPPTTAPPTERAALPAATSTQAPAATQTPAIEPSATLAAEPSATLAAEPSATSTLAAEPTPSSPSPTVLVVSAPTPIPVQLEFSRYVAYRVQPEDTLDSIAARGGTAPQIITIYNRLTGQPQAGRELIVPEVKGNQSTLESESLLVLKGNTSKPWVALTLDAGASSEPTGQMLDALKAANTRLTFFLTGKWMDENPDLTRRIVAEGHELANHSYTHSDFTMLSDAQIADELARTEEALHRIVGPDVSMRPFFRPPFGAYDNRVLEAVIANGYLPIYWTFDSLDSVGQPKTPEFLTARITANLPLDEMPGAIILAHCGSAATADALPAILRTFAEKGIEVRPLSDVMGP